MKFKKIILTTIILAAFLIRIIGLQNYPPSLNWDEISHGYNAYSILKTSKDEWGNFLPLIFRAYGDYKLPLYIYSSIPFIAILGLNTLSVKIISILSGTILAFIIFLIIKKIIPKQKYLPIIALLITAFSPSTIFLSRIALEANLFLCLFFISIYFLISKKYGFSSFFFGLCLFTYNSSRVILPFYLILLFILLKKNNYPFKQNIRKFIFFFITILFFLFQSFQNSGQARYKWVSILDQGAINQINELRQKYPRFLINKGTFFVTQATKNYISHFNPSYLFFQGGSHYQFSLPNFYLISPFLLPLFILGILNLFIFIRKRNFDHFLIILFCLLVSPLPSAITRDAPHVLRSIVLIPTTIIIITLSLSNLKTKFHKPVFFFICLVLFFSQINFWPKYKQYSVNFSDSWQYGYQQTISFIKNNYSDYDQIIFTKKYGEPHEFILFYWPWDPIKYHQDSNLAWQNHTDWYWVNSFDKFKFINDWEFKEKTKEINQKTLLITSPGNYNKDNTSLIKTIYFLDQTPAFDILSIYDQKQ